MNSHYLIRAGIHPLFRSLPHLIESRLQEGKELLTYEEVWGNYVRKYRNRPIAIKDSLSVYYETDKGYKWTTIPKGTLVEVMEEVSPPTFLEPQEATMYQRGSVRISPEVFREFASNLRQAKGEEEEEKFRAQYKELGLATGFPIRKVHRGDPILSFLTGRWINRAIHVIIDDRAFRYFPGASRFVTEDEVLGMVRILDLWHSLEPEAFEIIEAEVLKHVHKVLAERWG